MVQDGRKSAEMPENNPGGLYTMNNFLICLESRKS